MRFTCNKCGGRSERKCSPRALKKGSVFVQCAECEAWVSWGSQNHWHRGGRGLGPCSGCESCGQELGHPRFVVQRTPRLMEAPTFITLQHLIADHLNVAEEYRRGADGQWERWVPEELPSPVTSSPEESLVTEDDTNLGQGPPNLLL